MDHCAIDLGGKKSQVCVRSPDGQVRLETRCDTLWLPDFFRELPHSRVILETAAEAFRIGCESGRSRGPGYRRRWCGRWESARGGRRRTAATRRS